MDKITFRTGCVILLVAFGLISGVFYANSIATMPSGHHSWAMADYYAIAIKFAGNGLNLFQPQTFSLTTKNAVTASDFPLPAWLSGAAMLVLGSESPAIFRFLTLCLGFLGFFFFFRGLFEQDIPVIRAVVLTLFLWLLPGLVYYHDGFMPSTWALSAFLTGLWALQRDSRGDTRYWAVAVVAFVLAALIRKPYFLPLVSLGAWHILMRKDRKKTKTLFAGVFVFFLWQLYDLYLQKQYGSIFLRQFMAPHTVADALALAKEAWLKWGAVWFSPAHAVWILFMAGFGITRLRKRREAYTAPFSGWFFCGICLLGVAYFVLMLRQFIDHDYYIIDSFYPIIFTGVLGWARAIGDRKWLIWVETALFAAAVFWAGRTLNWYQGIAPNPKVLKTNKVYAESRPLLDSLGISRDARILVFEGFSSNLPLIGMGRNGYCLLSSRPEEQEKMLARQPDYAVCLDTNFIKEVVNDKPDIVKNLEFMGRNRDLWVFRPTTIPENTLEKLLTTEWIALADTTATAADEFLFSRSLPAGAGDKIIFHGMAGLQEGGELKATVALFKSGAAVSLQERVLTFAAREAPVYVATDINVPAIAADEMRVYLWNPARRNAEFSDFRVSVLKLKPLKR